MDEVLSLPIYPELTEAQQGRRGRRDPEVLLVTGSASPAGRPMFVTKPVVADRKIRFALVGCGRISANHFEAIAAHSAECELVGVCDVDPAALAAAEQKTGAPGFRSLEAMLAGTDADCVILATPSGLHAEQAIRVAAAGRHVMTEKPMATHWQDGKRMVAACDAAGVHLFVVKQNRRNPTLQLLKRAVSSGRFGRIYMVNVNVFWSRPQSYYDSAAWRGTWEFDGGAFMNQASHYVDLLDWLIGPGRERAGLHRHPGAQHPGRGHRRRRGPLAHRRARHHERHHARLPEELRGLDHDPRREGHRAHRRRGREQDRALGVRRAPIRTTTQVQQASYETTSVYGHGHKPYYENVIKSLRGQAVARDRRP